MAMQPKGNEPAYPPVDQAYPPPGQATYNPGNAGQPPPPAYAAQQPGYPQGGYLGQPAGVVVTQPSTTVVINNTVFRESPVNTTCPTCQSQVITSTSFEIGTMTWIVCAVLCFIGCDLGCCFIPFCVPSCKDVVHTCPNCNAQIGRYNRM